MNISTNYPTHHDGSASMFGICFQPIICESLAELFRLEDKLRKVLNVYRIHTSNGIRLMSGGKMLAEFFWPETVFVAGV